MIKSAESEVATTCWLSKVPVRRIDDEQKLMEYYDISLKARNQNHYSNRMDRQNRPSAVLHVPNPTPIFNYMTGAEETNQPSSEYKKSDQTTKEDVEYETSPLCFGITLGLFVLFFGILFIALVLVFLPISTVKPKPEGNCPVWVEKETPSYEWLRNVEVGKSRWISLFFGQVPFSKALQVCGVHQLVFPIDDKYVDKQIVYKTIEQNREHILQGENKSLLIWSKVKWTLQEFKTELMDTIYNENVKLKSYPTVSFCDDYIERIRYKNIIEQTRFNSTSSQDFIIFMKSEESSVYLVRDFSSLNNTCHQFYTEEGLKKRIGSKTGEQSVSLPFLCYAEGEENNYFTPGKLNELAGLYRGEAFTEVGHLKEQKNYSDLNQNEFKDIKLFFYAAPLTFDEAKLQCNSTNSTLLVLNSASMDRYIDYKIGHDPEFNWQKKLNNKDQNSKQEFMWTGGFFDLLSDKPLQLHWNDVQTDITSEMYTNFCDNNVAITAKIKQKLELLKTYKNADGTPCNSNTRRYMHIVRPFRLNEKSESCWTLYDEDVLYPGASNMGFICYFKQQN